MNKRKYEGEQTKKNIADKALTLFSKKGYAVTSIQDICDAAGCSKGNLYYHFKSKEDLFLYLMEQTFVEMWERWEKISSHAKSATDKLYAYGDFTAGIKRSMHSVEREFLNTVGTDSEAGQKLLSLINISFENTKKFITDGIVNGEFKNEDLFDLTYIVSVFYAGLNRYSTFIIDEDNKKTLFRKATTLLLQGISTRSTI